MIYTRIALVIVTYNRLAELKQCIEAVRVQTYKDFDIIVVNNGSTDGTKEYLDSQPDIISIHQDNKGGAGGFYTGQKYMYDNGYDWLWMMDDDGVPDENQLMNLISFAEDSGEKFLNALVIDRDNRKTLSFTAYGEWGSYDISDLQTKDYLVHIHPFNGTLIHRSVIEKVGFIKKEMFIWGDEQEYTKRVEIAGYTPITVTSAVHYHPKEKGVCVVVLPYLWKKGMLVKPRHLSHYYYRNLGYINQTYTGHPWSAEIAKKNTIYWLRKFDFKELFKFFKYYWKGIHNRY